MRPDQRTAPAALTMAIEAARLAPSVHNTQPWRWQTGERTLDLYREQDRLLPATDPHAWLLTMSCGAALHHARTALAAAGWQSTVDRVADPDRPNWLARITLTGRQPASPAAIRRYQTIRLRHTDRRATADVAVPDAAVDDIRRAIEECGAYLHTLGTAVSRANTLANTDPARRSESAAWTGGTGRATGIPDRAIPAAPPATDVPARDFGHSGGLRTGPGYDRHARYGILFGTDDTPVGWLRAGEALSAGWLTAVEDQLSLVPITGPIENTGTRQALRGLLSGLGHPYAAVRIGATEPDRTPPPATGRLDLDQISSGIGTDSER